jgi:DNA polymerase-3 subunit alpha
VFELADEEIARFLAAYWDCDGHVDSRCAWLKTISARMADDLQTLLLRLGIRTTVHKSTYAAVEGGRPITRSAYQVTTRGTRWFAELIQPFMLTEKAAVRTSAMDTSRHVSRERALEEILSA